MDYTNINVVLLWLAGVGAPYLVGKVFAYLAENWAQWHTFPKEVKFFSPMIVSVAVAIGATLLLQQTEFVASIGPGYAIVAQAIITWLGTQEGYMATKRSGYAASVKTPPQG